MKPAHFPEPFQKAVQGNSNASFRIEPGEGEPRLLAVLQNLHPNHDSRAGSGRWLSFEAADSERSEPLCGHRLDDAIADGPIQGDRSIVQHQVVRQSPFQQTGNRRLGPSAQIPGGPPNPPDSQDSRQRKRNRDGAASIGALALCGHWLLNPSAAGLARSGNGTTGLPVIPCSCTTLRSSTCVPSRSATSRCISMSSTGSSRDRSGGADC